MSSVCPVLSDTDTDTDTDTDSIRPKKGADYQSVNEAR